MLVQAETDEEMSLPLQVETDQAALAQDIASQRSTGFVWTGLGVAVLMLIGVSACALHPLALHGSAEPSRLAPEAATYVPSSAASILPEVAAYDHVPGGMPAPLHAVSPGRHVPATANLGGSPFRRSVLQPGAGRRSTRLRSTRVRKTLMFKKGATNEPNLLDAWTVAGDEFPLSFEEFREAATPPKVDLDLEKVIKAWNASAYNRLKLIKAWNASAYEELINIIKVMKALPADKIPRDQVMRDTVDMLELIKEDREAGVSDHLFGLAYEDMYHASPENIQALAAVRFVKQKDPSGEITYLAHQEGFTLQEAAGRDPGLAKTWPNPWEEAAGLPISMVEVTVFVANPAARQGVGRELMNKIIDWAKLNNKLLTLEPANAELRPYYKSLGFTELADGRLVHFGVREAEFARSQGFLFEVAP